MQPCYGKGFSPETDSVAQSHVWPQESVATLTSALYSRTQQSHESLADFSRALMRLHDKIHTAADGPEKAAIELMRDKVLKEQFSKGTRDVAARRELRRLQVEKPELSFFRFREQAIALLADFEDKDGNARAGKVREIAGDVEVAQASSQSTQASSLEQAISQMVASNLQIAEKMDALLKQQSTNTSTLTRLTNTIDNKLDDALSVRRGRMPVTCGFCKKPGHYARNCFKKMENNPVKSTEGSQGNAPPPS